MTPKKGLKMSFIKRFFYRKKADREFKHRLMLAHATAEAAKNVFHDMASTIGIGEMRLLLDEAEKSEQKYVSLVGLYIEALRKRRRDHES